MGNNPMTAFEEQYPKMVLKIHVLTAELDATRREALRCETELVERLQTALRKLHGLSSDGPRFFDERSKGWWWVTERGTRHNYAQTDSKENAYKICRRLNAANLLRLAPL